MAVDQSAFQFYQDGSEAGAAEWDGPGTESVDIEVTDDTIFLYRTLLQNNATPFTVGKGTVSLQYALNGGAWTTVTGGTPVQVVASGNLTNDASTTKRMSGTGTFITPNLGVVSTTASASCLANGFEFTANDHTEGLWALKLDTGALTISDYIDIRASGIATWGQVGRVTYASAATARVMVID